MKHDISTRADIELLVDRFYEKVLRNEAIKHFFNDVVKLDWSTHIPTMYNFWETMLLGSINYKGNPMTKHIELNRKATMGREHFDTWLKLWRETIDEHFTGSKANEAKARAESISQLMLYKIQGH